MRTGTTPLDELTRDEFERLQRLNAAYRERLRFPVLFAVKGSTTQDVLAASSSVSVRLRTMSSEKRWGRYIAEFRLRDALA
jgi:2-oxo-4-hydroxy-4-carboxy-5-ureidoimidazoline decarboxylase